MWDKPASLNAAANALFALAFLLCAYGAAAWTVRLPAFALRTARLETPVAHVTPEQVQAVLDDTLDGNFFTLDLERLRAGFEKLPWVRVAHVRREWPARVEIALEEHVPLARWGDAALVNTHGEVFTAAYDGTLPVLSGPDDRAQDVALTYREFQDRLAPIATLAQVDLSPRGAWRLKLDNGMVIELGREHIETRLERYLAAYARTVGSMPQMPAYVDLRYPNGFAVRAAQGGKA